MRVSGLLITKDDNKAFGDWCRDQCLDESEADATAGQAREFSDRLIYLHERDFKIPSKEVHRLRQPPRLQRWDQQRFGGASGLRDH